MKKIRTCKMMQLFVWLLRKERSEMTLTRLQEEKIRQINEREE